MLLTEKKTIQNKRASFSKQIWQVQFRLLKKGRERDAVTGKDASRKGKTNTERTIQSDKNHTSY